MNTRPASATGESNERPEGAAAAGGRSSSDSPDPLDAGRRLLGDVAVLTEHIRYLLSVRAVALKEKTRRIVLVSFAVFLVGAMAVTLVVVASAQLAGGLAGALSDLLPEKPWLGAVLSGAGILSALALAALAVGFRLRRRRRRAVTRRFRAWRRAVEEHARATAGDAGVGDETARA